MYTGFWCRAVHLKMNQQPLPQDVAIWLEELLQQQVRVNVLLGCYSLLDIIRHHKKTPYPQTELLRLVQKTPELSERIIYVQFDGRRQRGTPAILHENVPFLYQIFHSKLRLPRKPVVQPRPPLLAKLAFQQDPPPSNAAPYGWRWDVINQSMHPIHAEQQVVRYVRQLRAFGHRYTEIAAQLQRDQIYTRNRSLWSASQVEEVLHFDHEALIQQQEELLRQLKSNSEAG
jgi:hypothetical protein